MLFSVATLLINFMENSKISTKICFSMLKHSCQNNLLEKMWCSNFGVKVYHFSTWPTYPDRLFLKIIYWNKSMQRINIIITNEHQEQRLTTIQKFPRRQLFFSKKLISHFDINILSQPVAFVLKLSRKISVDKNLLYGKLS